MFSRYITRTKKMISQVLSDLQDFYLFTFTIDDSQIDHLSIHITFPKNTTNFSIDFANDDIKHRIDIIYKNSATNYLKKTLYYNVKSIL
jgi:hypothetical protein